MNEDHLGRGGVRAGDRAPDAAVVELPSLRTVTLFNDLYPGDWTLLAFVGPGEDREVQDRLLMVAQEIGKTSPDVRTRVVLADPVTTERVRAGEGVLLDLDRFAHQAYHIKCPSLFLVRPDGHVAFRGAADDADALVSYCNRVLGAGRSSDAKPDTQRQLSKGKFG